MSKQAIGIDLGTIYSCVGVFQHGKVEIIANEQGNRITKKFDDATIQSHMKHWPFTVVSERNKPNIQVEFKGEKKIFLPEEISSMLLTKMKEIAEAY